MLLGSGELGKEVAIAAKRLACKVIACDRYKDAPAMQVSDCAEVFNMNDAEVLKQIIRKYKPDIVIPEIEALAVDALQEIENEGINVIPNSRATKITMNRDKIRDLASNILGIKTARYFYASNIKELKEVSYKIGFPLVIKPIMSSSGKGQSLVKEKKQLEEAWNAAIKGARGYSKKVIVEEFLKFDVEITLLTIRQKNGATIFCSPIGHKQKNGDYQCSWQPANLSQTQINKAQSIAKLVTDNLGGIGLFGVEFFICGEEVVFSELSPRPHDTGLVTVMSQSINEFELHLRAILGLPIPKIIEKIGASRVILSDKKLTSIEYQGLEKALLVEDTNILLFGKPNAREGRRMGVAVATGDTIEIAQEKADRAANLIKIIPSTQN